jgi:hypothetical protein
MVMAAGCVILDGLADCAGQSIIVTPFQFVERKHAWHVRIGHVLKRLHLVASTVSSIR